MKNPAPATIESIWSYVNKRKEAVRSIAIVVMDTPITDYLVQLRYVWKEYFTKVEIALPTAAYYIRDNGKQLLSMIPAYPSRKPAKKKNPRMIEHKIHVSLMAGSFG